jgi:hypothetical protein
MKQFFIFIFVIISMSALACYSLGVFGEYKTRYVSEKEYEGDGFAFTGMLKNGKFDGGGKVFYQNGDSYEGAFKEGRFNGNGIYTSNENWRFEGIFENGDIRSGDFYYKNGQTASYERSAQSEILTSSAGWKYEGEFGNGGQNGAGSFIYPDGSAYYGGFINGFADGETCEYSAPDGALIYEGGFKNGLFDGAGIYHSPKGWKYEGGFKAGLFDGEGVITDNNKTVKGVWEKGKQVKTVQ